MGANDPRGRAMFDPRMHDSQDLCKGLLREGLSEPEFHDDLVYKLKKLIGRNDFSFQFRKIITRYRRIGYN